MAREFKVEISCHKQKCFQAADLSREECRLIQGIVTNKWMDSKDYQLARDCSPFLQGFTLPFEGEKDGWVLVEFWSHNDAAIAAYIEHVNQELKNAEQADAEKFVPSASQAKIP